MRERVTPSVCPMLCWFILHGYSDRGHTPCGCSLGQGCIRMAGPIGRAPPPPLGLLGVHVWSALPVWPPLDPPPLQTIVTIVKCTVGKSERAVFGTQTSGPQNPPFPSSSTSQPPPPPPPSSLLNHPRHPPVLSSKSSQTPPPLLASKSSQTPPPSSLLNHPRHPPPSSLLNHPRHPPPPLF